MAQKLIVRKTCPLCHEEVPHVPDHILKASSDHQNVEFVQTKRGVKQYYHTSCWNKMIKDQREEARNREAVLVGGGNRE